MCTGDATGTPRDSNYGTIDFQRFESSKLERFVSGFTPLRGAENLVKSFVTSADGDRALLDGCRYSRNVKVLALTTSLFIVITIAQLIGAVRANSDTLMIGAVSMAVDTMTYFLNMLAEHRKDAKHYDTSQLFISGVSITVLVYFTTQVVFDALPKLHLEALPILGPSDAADDISCDAYIVLSFATWGIVFDLICLIAFARSLKRSNGREINIMGALQHVGFDLARSFSTLVGAIHLVWFSSNSLVTDAWSCLVVASIILIGVIFAVKEFIRNLLLVILRSRILSAV